MSNMHNLQVPDIGDFTDIAVVEIYIKPEIKSIRMIHLFLLRVIKL